jgi:small subunit ribosomal protein S21
MGACEQCSLPSEGEAGDSALAPGSPGGFRARFEGSWTAFMQIIVRDNNVDQALRALKKKLQREGVYREMKLRRHYEKPSEKRARERAAAIRRARKLERKRMEREGTAR